MSFGSPAPGTALENVAVMKKSVEHRGDRGGIAQKFSPVLNRAVRREQGAGAFVPSHHDLEQVFGSSCREFLHSQIVNDQERNRGEAFHLLFARSVESGVSNVIEERVRFTVEHAISL